MKNTRRFISAVMALVMAAGTTMYVSAEDVPTTATLDEFTSSGSTEVKYSVDPSYTVVIPASVTLSDTSTTNATISVDETAKPFKLAKGQTLSINIADVETNDFKVKCDTVEVPYTVTAGTSTTALEKGSTAAAFTNDDKTAKTLTFSQINSTLATVAGEYTGTLTFGISVENAAPANPYAANSVGDVVTFGNYNWYIIGKSDNGVTLLMKDNLENKAYNDSFTDVKWENCTLRTYLNETFYNTFSAEDKAKIVKTSNTNPNNPNYSTSGGNDTEDYIYLLSLDEANALDNSIRAINSWWWLRSPGQTSKFAAVVFDNNIVSPYGSNVDSGFGVRPALNLEF